MDKLFVFLRSFRARVTLVLIAALIFAAALSNLLVYRFALDSQFRLLQDKLKVIAQTAALSINADTLLKVPLNREGINTPYYKEIADTLMKIKEANPPIKYIYTMAKTDKEGTWQFVVDPVAPSVEESARGLSSYPGDRYDASRFPQMLKAFEVASADTKLEIDEWGITLSGYAPIRDKEGRTVAVLGIDMLADDVYAVQQAIHQRALFVLGIGLLVALFLGTIISQQITSPIQRLVEGTHHLAGGDLRYRVDIKTVDEIGELAGAFNNMSQRLGEARKKLLNYFYGIAQSLVRVLEAREQFTSGHSERVSRYAEKIALRMGFSKEKAQLLKETALLHDIGKIGIRRSILNKEGPLTEEEWNTIRQHPKIGKEILEPIAFSEEMIEVIKGHHERYDGQGYPDKLSGTDINIFAAITSVADAYDAMTSLRVYRDALTKEQAIQELKKNKGKQFNPEVVDAFLKILEEESGN